MRRLLILLLVVLNIASPALAGMKAVYSSQQREATRIQIEVADNGDVRVGKAGRANYGLLIGDTFYLVIKAHDEWKVTRLADVMAAYGKLPSFNETFLIDDTDIDLNIDKQGSRQVDERMGTVYRVTGQHGTIEYVMSDDPALVPLGRGLEKFEESLLVMMMPILGEDVVEMIAETRRLYALGTPIGGDIYKLEAVEAATVKPERLALPAQPLTVDEIVKAMQALMGENPSDP